MEALRGISSISLPSLIRSQVSNPIFSLSFTRKQSNKSPLPNLTLFGKSKFSKSTSICPCVSTQHEEATESVDEDEKFDWFGHWYPVMPVCDLDKRAPIGKKVLGLDVVVWWDKNENEWKVFDDRCPHRLAPLSEGRIDQWGRLQCVYHGWCFGGSGDCKLIPQAPLDCPPVHSFPKACVAVYPSTTHQGIVWFWPNTDLQYKDIPTEKKPPYIPQLDDPSLSFQMFNRDIPYGYEVLIENLMDASHVPYAHSGIMQTIEPSVKVDREGGSPIDTKILKLDKSGFTTSWEPYGLWNFVSPFTYQITVTEGKLAENPHGNLLTFFCVPVSPGNSRLILVIPRNFWRDFIPFRWLDHIFQNLVIDSDLYLLRIEEEKFMAVGLSNWDKVCFVPTKADTNVVAYRKWLKKYAGGQFDWGTKFSEFLPHTPPREQLMDRYWSHVMNCTSCNAAYKGFNALHISLQLFSVSSVAIVAATKQGTISVATRNTLAAAAILCFVGSKWLSHFIYKNFHFHDYNHAFK